MSRKRVLGWIFGVIGGLILLLVVGGYFLLRSGAFHHYVIAKIEEKAQQSTGGRVEIKSFDFHLGSLSADVYGLVVHGTEPAQARPLLAVNHIYVDLKLVSLIHHKVDLNEIVVDRPVVNLISYKNGETNIPHPQTPKNDSGSSINVFDLGIQHVLLDQGAVYYNQQKSPMQAELHDLRAEVTYKTLGSKYVGSVSYDHGQIQLSDAASLPHSLSVNFTATPSQLAVSSATLKLASSQVDLQGNVTDFSQPKATAEYHILIRPQDFQDLIGSTASAKGDIHLSGNLGYQSSSGEPLLKSISVHGKLESTQLDVVTAQAQLPIRTLRGNYSLVNGALRATGIAADLLGGHLDAQLDLLHMTGTPVGRFHADLAGLSLGTIRRSAQLENVKATPLTGRIDGSVNGGWTGQIHNLEATANIMLKGAVSPQSATPLPLNAAIHLNYNGARSIITFNNTYLRTPETTVQVAGTMSDRSNLQVQARTHDIHELSKLAAALKAPTPGQTSPTTPVDISGTAQLTASLHGTLNNPQISGNASAQNLVLHGGHWRTAQFSFQASPSGVKVSQGSIIAQPKGQASFAMSVGLNHWKYAPSNRLTANVTVQQLPVAQLQQVANLDYPVVGNLSAKINFDGSQLNPMGNGSVELTQATAYKQTIQNLTVDFHATGNNVDSTLSVKMPAGPVTANVQLNPKTKTYQLKMNAPGIDLSKLDAVKERNVPLSGTLTASATGQGSFANPQVSATLQIPQLQVRQATVNQVRAQLNLANHRGDLTLNSDLASASIQAKANVDLTGKYYSTVSFDTKGIPLGPLVALYKPVPDQFQGLIEVHATAKGPLKQASQMEAHLTIPTLRASYQQLEIANQGPIRADYVNSVIRIPQAQLTGTDTSLQIHGEIPLKGGTPQLTATGSVNMQLLRIVSSDIQSSGKMVLDLHAVRTATAGVGVQGQVKLENVGLSTATAPLGVENLNSTFDIKNNQVQVAGLNAKVGGGQITGGGSLTYKPAMKFNLTLSAKNIRLRYPEGVRTVLDSNLAFTGTPQDSALTGRVLIDGVSFTPDFDLASFIGQFGGGGTVPSSGGSFTQNLHLSMTLQTTSNLNLVSSTLSLQGQANLRVIGTAANPVIVGRANFTGGEVFFMNRRYQIMRGIVDFTNPNRTEPVVNMLITTTVQQYNLSLSFIGPVDRLRTSYTSEPPLPPVDVINLLARGQTTEESAPASLSANSVLAKGLSQVSGQVTGRLQKLAGLSSLQIDPTLGGNGSDPTARVAIQQRVTKNFIFTFSTDVTDPESQVVQGEYQVDKHWSVSALRNQYGGYAFDAKYHTTF